MIRFIRALIYGAFAAIAATLLFDWLDHRSGHTSGRDGLQTSRLSGNSADQLGEDAKKALLDELAAQV